MNTLIETIKYFIFIMGELALLFIAISTVIALVFMYIPQDKLKTWMSGKGIWGNIMAVLYGAVTPFCACSTVPMTLGLLQAGVPFGTVMSFVIASPLMDPLVFILLGTFMGWKVAVGFLILTSIFSVVFGVILEKMGWADQVKKVRMKGNGHGQNEEVPKDFKNRLKLSFLKAWGDFKGVLIYMIIGVAIGAAIYGYLPEELLAKVAGRDNPLAVLAVALIGMPLYIRVEAAIPIGLALLDKGASIGAVIALIISGAGIAIPELTMFASIFKKKIIIAFVVIVFVMAVISGLIFNMLLVSILKIHQNKTEGGNLLMKNENEKKGLFERLAESKKAKKGSCCCSFEIEEITDEKENNKDKEATKEGIVLSVTLVDGEVIKTKIYPTNEELSEWLNVEIKAQQSRRRRNRRRSGGGGCGYGSKGVLLRPLLTLKN